MKRLSLRMLLGISIATLTVLSAQGSVSPAPALTTLTAAKAVSLGKPGAAVAIRHELSGKPAIGASTELVVELIPAAAVDSLEAKLSGVEGIVLSGSHTATFTSVEPGKVYRHKMSIIPDRSGVFHIAVSVRTRTDGATLGRAFSIPVEVALK